MWVLRVAVPPPPQGCWLGASGQTKQDVGELKWLLGLFMKLHHT